MNINLTLPFPLPHSQSMLLEHATALAGFTLGELALYTRTPIPTHLHHAKGWVGQFIEKLLGVANNNLDQPDFIHLGIELKTLPLSQDGTPRESTYLCYTPIPETASSFQTSRVWRKLAKILWIPIESTPQAPIAERRVGTPLLWSPCPKTFAILKQDWEELSELITLGHFDKLDAKKGTYLQIRPKAPHSKQLKTVLNQEGQLVHTVPKGFYLRTLLTKKIIQSAF